MNEWAIAVVFLCGAGAVAVYATFGRLSGFHRSMPWSGGGHSTLTGELAIAGFLACAGLHVLVSPVFVIPSFICWLIGSRSQANSNRRFAKQEEELRELNAKEYPGIFECDPPQHLDLAETEFVDVYDCGSCVYLGCVSANHIANLIAATVDMPEQGPNDIFVIEEMVEPGAVPDANEMKAFLQDHFDSRGYAVLRWFPVEKSK